MRHSVEAFLAQVLRAPFSLDDSWKGQFLNHLRTLNPPAARQFDISSEVLDHLAMAVYRSDLPHPQVFKSPIQVHKSQDGVVAWVLPTTGFPCPPPQTATSGEQTVSWIHFPSEEGLSGIFRTGLLLPTTRRTLDWSTATGHWVFSAGQQ